MRLAVSGVTTVAVSSTVLGVGMSLFLGYGHWRGIGMLRRVLAIVALALGAFAGSLLITIGFAVGLIVAGAIGVVCSILAYRYRRG